MEQSRNFLGNSRNNDPKCQGQIYVINTYKPNLIKKQQQQEEQQRKAKASHSIASNMECLPKVALMRFGMQGRSMTQKIALGTKCKLHAQWIHKKRGGDYLRNHFGSIGYVLGLFDSNLRVLPQKTRKVMEKLPHSKSVAEELTAQHWGDARQIMLQRVSDDPFALCDASEERSLKGDHEIVMLRSFHRL